MKIIILLFFIAYIQGLESTDFTTVMNDLSNLEKYIKQYKEEKSEAKSLTHLIVAYIREGVYSDTTWGIAGGEIPKDLVSYIEEKDTSEGTNSQATRKYRSIELPNKEKIDFVHLFAVMNGIEFGNSYTKNFAHLVGWGGDTTQLFEDIKNEKGTLDELMNACKNYFRIKGGFDEADLISDLDAPILLSKKDDSNTFADIFTNYYTGKEYLERINKFVNLTFPELKSKEKFREEIFNIYNSDFYIQVLECKDGFRESSFSCMLPGAIKPEYTDHQKAAVYVVSDYLSENFVEPDPEPSPSPTPSPSFSRVLNISILSLFLLVLMII